MSNLEYNRMWKQRHKEYVREYQKKWRAEHKEELQAYTKNYYQIHKKEHKEYMKEYHRPYWLKSEYNLTPEQYADMLTKQNNRCAICGEPLDLQNPHRVHIDHDHNTGKVRGILCNKCNMAIGLFRHNPEYTNNATKYLEVVK